MALRHPYSLGLHEIGDGLHAYLQPDGGWGWSNAGLIVGDGVSLLVDTLFDLHLTAAMLDSMTSLTTAAPVASLVNTHANGDHCYGNSEVTRRWSGTEIIASTATAHEMADVPPSMLAALNQAPGDVGELFRSFFGEFDFDGIELEPPTRTFDHRLTIDVGGRAVELSRSARRTQPATPSCTCPMPRPCSPATSSSSGEHRSCGRARCRTGSPPVT